MKARSINKLTLLGNLTADPRYDTVEAGWPVCTFTVATDSIWKDKEGNEQKDTQFHRIVAFNKLAEICAELLKKGNKVYLEGELRYKKIEFEDGSFYWKADVRLNEIIVLEKKKIEEVI